MSQNPSSKKKSLMLEILKRSQSRSKFQREINPAISSKEKPPFQREIKIYTLNFGRHILGLLGLFCFLI